VKCWGENASGGRLGYGDISDRGDGANEMGNYLDFVDLGTNRKAIQISLGYYHTMAILDNGDLKVWGAAADGQIGQGDTYNRGDNAAEMGNDLDAVELGAGIWAKSAIAGEYYSCVITTQDNAACWGDNDNGQLGRGDDTDYGGNSGEMGDDLTMIQVGSGRTIIDMCAAQNQNCVIRDDSSVVCWGDNIWGMLGIGNSTDIGDDANEMGNYLQSANMGSGRTAIEIHCGGDTSCAVLDDNSFKCWGDNFRGQVGQGHFSDIADDPNEMGDYLPPINFGAGLSILECDDVSPTASPSINFSPTDMPSSAPTMNPTQSYNPTLSSLAPSIGVGIIDQIQHGSIQSDYIWGLDIDSEGDFYVMGYTSSGSYFASNAGLRDPVAIKYDGTTFTEIWGYQSGDFN